MTDQAETPKTTHGGPRGGGRPPLSTDGDRATRHTITLPIGLAPEIAARADGNLSAAVRMLWEFYQEQHELPK